MLLRQCLSLLHRLEKVEVDVQALVAAMRERDRANWETFTLGAAAGASAALVFSCSAFMMFWRLGRR
jgi:hypothetical protein